MLVGTYSPWLVLVSLLVAVLASFTGLDMAERISATEPRTARWWLLGGSTAVGIGIWSMHFIGMMALRMPMRMGYDPLITFLSLLMGIAAALFSLWLVCFHQLTRSTLVLGAILMGSGVCAMHYTGMAAMRMHPSIQYDSRLVALSIAIAIVASGVALWILSRLRQQQHRRLPLRLGAASLLGLAIAGMHYTGMAAAHFPRNSLCGAAQTGLHGTSLFLLVTIASLSVLTIALLTSVLDHRLQLRTAALSSSLEHAHNELSYLALHDSLTKLPNRVLMENHIEQAIHQARKSATAFSLMFLDLDGFKAVNDAYGHQIGDQLLVAVAERLLHHLRSGDSVARIGGDEFVLVVQAAEPAQAAGFADRIIASLKDPFQVAGHPLHISASLGIAIHKGDDEGQHDLLKKADAAMYHAKNDGKNSYCFFKASMSANAHAELELIQDLRLAIERDEFVLYYQPKFDAATLEVTGVEALLRWRNASRGLIPPSAFIPLAEKTGLILSIGYWTLDRACRQMAAWRDAGHSRWSVAVNLSALQFTDTRLVSMVRDTLERYRLAPQHLILEITESTAMRDPETSLILLDSLHRMGVRISIDDFGTGYSSLLYLKRLPATELKIDRGFVRDLQQNGEDAAIISAIVALGKTLNLGIVAEGVETEDQHRFLSQLGCTTLQGFLLGEPVTAEEISSADYDRSALRPQTALSVAQAPAP